MPTLRDFAVQDHSAILDYTVDLTDQLDGRNIASAEAFVTNGLELGSGSREPTWDDKSVTFWAISAKAQSGSAVIVRVSDDNLPPRTLNDVTIKFKIEET